MINKEKYEKIRREFDLGVEEVDAIIEYRIKEVNQGEHVGEQLIAGNLSPHLFSKMVARLIRNFSKVAGDQITIRSLLDLVIVSTAENAINEPQSLEELEKIESLLAFIVNFNVEDLKDFRPSEN